MDLISLIKDMLHKAHLVGWVGAVWVVRRLKSRTLGHQNDIPVADVAV